MSDTETHEPAPQPPPQRRGALLALLFIVVLLVGGVWVERRMHANSLVEDCMLAHRNNCDKLVP
jgi:hypothetical protein